MMAVPKFETLQASEDSGILVVRFNRPVRKNAFNKTQYNETVAALDYATKNDAIRVVVLTGNGDYYSSGNDLSIFMQTDLSDEKAKDKALEDARVLLLNFVNAFIRFPKILIGAVNGPAIGVAATTLAHCDFLYASEAATCTFPTMISSNNIVNTPFVPLGQTPEATSSFLFPQRLGQQLANEVLYLNRKLTAQDALNAKFVNAVYKKDELLPKVMEVAKILAQSPPHSLFDSKKLVHPPALIEHLEKVNQHEVEVLVGRWKSEEFAQAIMNFMTNKSRSKL